MQHCKFLYFTWIIYKINENYKVMLLCYIIDNSISIVTDETLLMKIKMINDKLTKN